MDEKRKTDPTVKTGVKLVLSRIRLNWDVLCRAHHFGWIPSPSELINPQDVLLDEETSKVFNLPHIEGDNKEDLVCPISSKTKHQREAFLEGDENILPLGKDDNGPKRKLRIEEDGNKRDTVLSNACKKKREKEELLEANGNMLPTVKGDDGAIEKLQIEGDSNKGDTIWPFESEKKHQTEELLEADEEILPLRDDGVKEKFQIEGDSNKGDIIPSKKKHQTEELLEADEEILPLRDDGVKEKFQIEGDSNKGDIIPTQNKHQTEELLEADEEILPLRDDGVKEKFQIEGDSNKGVTISTQNKNQREELLEADEEILPLREDDGAKEKFRIEWDSNKGDTMWPIPSEKKHQTEELLVADEETLPLREDNGAKEKFRIEGDSNKRDTMWPIASEKHQTKELLEADEEMKQMKKHQTKELREADEEILPLREDDEAKEELRVEDGNNGGDTMLLIASHKKREKEEIREADQATVPLVRDDDGAKEKLQIECNNNKGDTELRIASEEKHQVEQLLQADEEILPLGKDDDGSKQKLEGKSNEGNTGCLVTSKKKHQIEEVLDADENLTLEKDGHRGNKKPRIEGDNNEIDTVCPDASKNKRPIEEVLGTDKNLLPEEEDNSANKRSRNEGESNVDIDYSLGSKKRCEREELFKANESTLHSRRDIKQSFCPTSKEIPDVIFVNDDDQRKEFTEGKIPGTCENKIPLVTQITSQNGKQLQDRKKNCVTTTCKNTQVSKLKVTPKLKELAIVLRPVSVEQVMSAKAATKNNKRDLISKGNSRGRRKRREKTLKEKDNVQTNAVIDEAEKERKKILDLKREVESLEKSNQRMHEATALIQNRISNLEKELERKPNGGLQVRMDVAQKANLNLREDSACHDVSVVTSPRYPPHSIFSNPSGKERENGTDVREESHLSKVLDKSIAEVISEIEKKTRFERQSKNRTPQSSIATVNSAQKLQSNLFCPNPLTAPVTISSQRKDRSETSQNNYIGSRVPSFVNFPTQNQGLLYTPYSVQCQQQHWGGNQRFSQHTLNEAILTQPTPAANTFSHQPIHPLTREQPQRNIATIADKRVLNSETNYTKTSSLTSSSSVASLTTGNQVAVTNTNLALVPLHGRLRDRQPRMHSCSTGQNQQDSTSKLKPRVRKERKGIPPRENLQKLIQRLRKRAEVSEASDGPDLTVYQDSVTTVCSGDMSFPLMSSSGGLQKSTGNTHPNYTIAQNHHYPVAPFDQTFPTALSTFAVPRRITNKECPGAAVSVGPTLSSDVDFLGAATRVSSNDMRNFQPVSTYTSHGTYTDHGTGHGTSPVASIPSSSSAVERQRRTVAETAVNNSIMYSKGPTVLYNSTLLPYSIATKYMTVSHSAATKHTTVSPIVELQSSTQGSLNRSFGMTRGSSTGKYQIPSMQVTNISSSTSKSAGESVSFSTSTCTGPRVTQRIGDSPCNFNISSLHTENANSTPTDNAKNKAVSNGEGKTSFEVAVVVIDHPNEGSEDVVKTVTTNMPNKGQDSLLTTHNVTATQELVNATSSGGNNDLEQSVVSTIDRKISTDQNSNDSLIRLDLEHLKLPLDQVAENFSNRPIIPVSKDDNREKQEDLLKATDKPLQFNAVSNSENGLVSSFQESESMVTEVGTSSLCSIRTVSGNVTSPVVCNKNAQSAVTTSSNTHQIDNSFSFKQKPYDLFALQSFCTRSFDNSNTSLEEKSVITVTSANASNTTTTTTSLPSGVQLLPSSAISNNGRPFPMERTKESVADRSLNSTNSVVEVSLSIANIVQTALQTNSALNLSSITKPGNASMPLINDSNEDRLSSSSETRIQNNFMSLNIQPVVIVDRSTMALPTTISYMASNIPTNQPQTRGSIYSNLPLIRLVNPLPPEPKATVEVKQGNVLLTWKIPSGCLPTVTHYEIYAYIVEDLPHINCSDPWRIVSTVKATKNTMSCLLTEFEGGLSYRLSVRAVDILGRKGPHSIPCKVNVNKKRCYHLKS